MNTTLKTKTTTKKPKFKKGDRVVLLQAPDKYQNYQGTVLCVSLTVLKPEHKYWHEVQWDHSMDGICGRSIEEKHLDNAPEQ